MNFELWSRQIPAIIRLELKKYVFGRRWIVVYLLALAPVFLLGLRMLTSTRMFDMTHNGVDIDESVSILEQIYAGFFQLYLLRFAIFFGCVVIFTQLFRGEVIEKTLHYYLLAPVRREVLATGKYLTGVATAIVLFMGSTIATYLLIFAPLGSASFNDFFFSGSGFANLLRYAAVTILGCVGYGAVFTFVSLYFRNPVPIAIMLLGWESFNFIMPELLQKLSIVHYLQSICPVSIPQGPLAVITSPTSAWYSVPGLLILTAAVLIVASLKIRRIEITYSAD